MLLLPVVRLIPAKWPIAVLPFPIVLLKSAFVPMAVLLVPPLLLPSAPEPLAVFPLPVVLWKSANVPAAVLSWPVVLLKSASKPVAVLNWPVVLFARASSPKKAFSKMGSHPLRHAERALGARTSAARAVPARRKPSRRGDCGIKFTCEVFIFLFFPFVVRANLSFAVFPCGKRARWSSSGRRLTDLAHHFIGCRVADFYYNKST